MFAPAFLNGGCKGFREDGLSIHANVKERKQFVNPVSHFVHRGIDAVLARCFLRDDLDKVNKAGDAAKILMQTFWKRSFIVEARNADIAKHKRAPLGSGL